MATTPPALYGELERGLAVWLTRSGRRVTLDMLGRLLERALLELPADSLRKWLQQIATEAAEKARKMILAGQAIKAATEWESTTYSPLTVLLRNMEILAGYPNLPPSAKSWYVTTGQLAESLEGVVLGVRGKSAWEGTIVIRPRPGYPRAAHWRAGRGRALTPWRLWNLLQKGATYQVDAERREAILGYAYALAITLGWVDKEAHDYERFKRVVLPTLPAIGSTVHLPARPLFVGGFLREIASFVQRRIARGIGGVAEATVGWVNYDCHPGRAPEIWKALWLRRGV